MNSTPIHSALLGLGLVILCAPAPSQAQPHPIPAQLTQAMAAWLGSLDADQREGAVYEFSDDERFDLRLAPLSLEGLRIDEMGDAQWLALHAALASVLSAEGMRKVDTIRSLEREVAQMGSGFTRWLMPGFRDEKRYFLALFGEPSAAESWGMRFDGHHLSLNWTSVRDAPLSVTPLFLGGQPRQVPSGFDRAGLRVLADEEDRAIELIASLSEAQRAKSEVAWGGGSAIRRPMMIAAPPHLVLDEPVGLPRGDLDPNQASLLDALLEVQLANFRPSIASRHRASFAAQAESIRFAYGVSEQSPKGVPAAGDPFYYRIHGETFLIEFDNTADEADHVHVVWRELDGDFGRDVLREHVRDHHGRLHADLDESDREPTGRSSR